VVKTTIIPLKICLKTVKFLTIAVSIREKVLLSDKIIILYIKPKNDEVPSII